MNLLALLVREVHEHFVMSDRKATYPQGLLLKFDMEPGSEYPLLGFVLDWRVAPDCDREGF